MPSSMLEGTLGAYLIGVIVASLLFGITCAQTFYYFQHYADRPMFRMIVGALWVLDAIHSALICHTLYVLAVNNFADEAALDKAVWSGCLAIGISGNSTLIVHLFYARRVWLIGDKNIPLTCLIVLLASIHFGFAWAMAGLTLKLVYFPAVTHGIMQPIGQVGLGSAVAVDTLIAASLCFYLHSSRTGVRRTNTLINKLILYAINNGILTSTVDVVTLIFFILKPDDLIHMATYQIVGKLYVNSLLATLNSRPTAAPIIHIDSSILNLSRLQAVQAAVTCNGGVSHAADVSDLEAGVLAELKDEKPSISTTVEAS